MKVLAQLYTVVTLSLLLTIRFHLWPVKQSLSPLDSSLWVRLSVTLLRHLLRSSFYNHYSRLFYGTLLPLIIKYLILNYMLWKTFLRRWGQKSLAHHVLSRIRCFLG